MEKNIVILGPTASGKTAFAVRLADRLNGEIIGVDSRQVYRGLDLGSGKDLAEYTLPDGRTVPVHLIDIADPARETYSLADFLADAAEAETEIRSRGKQPVYAGGTALYLHGILSGYHLSGGAPDPAERTRLRNLPLEALHAELRTLEPDPDVLREEPANRVRIIRKIETMRRAGTPRTGKEHAGATRTGQDFLVLGTLRTRAEIHRRIEARLDERLAQGMTDEAVYLHDTCGVSWEKLESFGLEYRYMALYQQGKLSRDDMRDQLLCKIRQFAKRQDSWFRKMEREGLSIHWLPPENLDEAERLVRAYLSGEPLPEPSFRISETLYGRKTD